MRLGWGFDLQSRRALGATLGILAAGLVGTGCLPSQCEERPCPEPFDVALWCFEQQGCELDGGPADCGPDGTCTLDPGQTLVVPVGAFVSELGTRQQLSLSPTNLKTSINLQQSFSATIDGQAAAHVPTSGSTTSVVWTPFPAAGNRLDVHYSGGATDIWLRLWFHDLECEGTHPESDYDCSE